MKLNFAAALSVALLATTSAASPTPEKGELVPKGNIQKRSFWATCNYCAMNGVFLGCNCQDRNGEWRRANLDLNKCIGNYDGILKWSSNGNYGYSCNVGGQNGNNLPNLGITCGDGRGGNIGNWFNLDDGVHNTNGQLSC